MRASSRGEDLRWALSCNQFESLTARLISISFTIFCSVENMLAGILPEGIKKFNHILAAFEASTVVRTLHPSRW